MQFNSYVFILLFLPICVMGYWVLNQLGHKLAEMFLIIMSIVLYGYYNVKFLILLFFSILINYAAYRIMASRRSNRRIILIMSIIATISILFYFKYYNFFVDNINDLFKCEYNLQQLILPLGISFFTFQQIAFLVDAYYGKIKECQFKDYVLFVVYFSKIAQGPIILYDEIIFQIKSTIDEQGKRSIDFDNIAKGIQMFAIGLSKKVILGDTFGMAVAWGFENVPTASAMDLLLVVLSYTFQIYFDFSGYCDMANGVSLMLNIALPVNFDSPYKALSILDFWRRWHMTLTRFLRDYIYIPLGGSKKGQLKTYANTMIIFGISGLWHGANWTYIIWGLLHGVASCLNRKFKQQFEKLHVTMQWLLTFTFLNITWLLFRAENISQFFLIVKKIVCLENLNISKELISCFDIVEVRFWLESLGISDLFYKVNGLPILIFLGVALGVCLNGINCQDKKFSMSVRNILMTVFLTVWSIVSLGNATGFLYFGF